MDFLILCFLRLPSRLPWEGIFLKISGLPQESVSLCTVASVLPGWPFQCHLTGWDFCPLQLHLFSDGLFGPLIWFSITENLGSVFFHSAVLNFGFCPWACPQMFHLIQVPQPPSTVSRGRKVKTALLGSLLLWFFVVGFFRGGGFDSAFRILILQPGIKPMPSTVNTQHPNHWTTREFLHGSFLKDVKPSLRISLLRNPQ